MEDVRDFELKRSELISNHRGTQKTPYGPWSNRVWHSIHIRLSDHFSGLGTGGKGPQLEIQRHMAPNITSAASQRRV